ncbi:hypothetical protein HDV05_008554, partial [Chytridiales sp. JEL 0842]
MTGQLESNVLAFASLKEREDAEVVSESIYAFLARSSSKRGAENTAKTQGFESAETYSSLEARATLALLLFASFFESLPVTLTQSILESIFIPNATTQEGRPKRHWALPSLSPLFWRVQERITYLGLLVTMLELDYKSETSQSSTTNPRTENLKKLKHFHPALLALSESFYISHFHNPSKQTFSYLHTPLPPTLTSILPNLSPKIALVLLETLQFYCKSPNPHLLISSFPSLIQTLKWCATSLSSHALDLVEALDIEAEEEGEVVDSEEPEELQTEARAFELKLRLFSGVDAVFEALENGRGGKLKSAEKVRKIQGRLQKSRWSPAPEGLVLK